MDGLGTIQHDFNTPLYDASIERSQKYREDKREADRIHKRNAEYYSKFVSRTENLHKTVQLSGKPVKVCGGYDEMRDMVESGKL